MPVVLESIFSFNLSIPLNFLLEGIEEKVLIIQVTLDMQKRVNNLSLGSVHENDFLLVYLTFFSSFLRQFFYYQGMKDPISDSKSKLAMLKEHCAGVAIKELDAGN